jgi:hypothetical protein
MPPGLRFWKVRAGRNLRAQIPCAKKLAVLFGFMLIPVDAEPAEMILHIVLSALSICISIVRLLILVALNQLI